MWELEFIDELNVILWLKRVLDTIELALQSSIKSITAEDQNCKVIFTNQDFSFSNTVNDKHVRSPQVGLSAK